jgi:hypothetical protein
MNDFFAGVGDGDTAGIWDRMPEPRPEFRGCAPARDRQAGPHRAEHRRPGGDA